MSVNLKNFLNFSPYDYESNSEQVMRNFNTGRYNNSTDFFLNELLVKEVFKEVGHVLSSKLNDNVAEPNKPQFFLLKGYKGSGKTVFINYFFNEKKFNYINFNLVNSREYENNSKEIILEYMSNLVLKLIEKKGLENLKKLNQCVENRIADKPIFFFNELEKKCFNDVVEKFDNEKFEKYLTFKKDYDKNNNLGYTYTERSFEEKIKVIYSFFFSFLFLDFEGTLDIISELASYDTNKNNIYVGKKQSKKEVILIFDGLDHIIPHFDFSSFVEILHKLVDIFCKINPSKDSGITCSLLFAFRPSSFNKKIEKKLSNISYIHELKELNLTSGNNFELIIGKRFEVYSTINESNNDSPEITFFNWLKADNNSNFQGRIIKTFNNSYRELINFFFMVFDKFKYDEKKGDFGHKVFQLETINSIIKKKISFEEEEDISKSLDRGIVFFILGKNYYPDLKEFFIRKTKKNDKNPGTISQERVILGKLLSLSKNNIDLYNRRIGLFDLYQKIYKEKYLKESDNFTGFIEVIINLYNSKNRQSELPRLIDITVSGSLEFYPDIQLYNAFKTEEINKNLLKSIAELKSEYNLFEIGITPLGELFCNNLNRHFEMYSVRANNSIPLLLSLEKEINHKKNESIKEVKFLFETIIGKVFQTAKVCLDFIIEYNLEKSIFVKDALSRENNNGYKHHSIQIIHTHVTYIDTFRLVMLGEKGFINKISEKFRINDLEVKKELNSRIAISLVKYIQLIDVKLGRLKEATEKEEINSIRMLKQDLKKSLGIIEQGNEKSFSHHINYYRNERKKQYT